MKLSSARVVLILLIFVGLAAVSYHYSPYRQIRSIWSVVEIDAPANSVWQVLTDLNGYGSWNPFITSASGELAAGKQIRVTLKLGDHRLSMRPRIVGLSPGKRFVWADRSLVPGVINVEHAFELEEIDQSHTRLIQSAHFKGLLVGFLWDRIYPSISGGFRAMNQALKARCEQTAGAQP